MLLLQLAEGSDDIYFSIKVCMLFFFFFRYNAIAYLIDYGIVLTLLLYALGNQKIPIDLLYCGGLGLYLQYL